MTDVQTNMKPVQVKLVLLGNAPSLRCAHNPTLAQDNLARLFILFLLNSNGLESN